MIVVDVNVVAYLLIPGKYTEAAERLFQEDPVWVVPRLWRSELRNILATYMRAGQMDRAEAMLIFQRAAELVGSEEYEVETADVLRASEQGKCSAYDGEYLALAEFLDLVLVTADAKWVRAFPGRARSLSDH